MVEGARLESVYRGNSIASSNLAVSAKQDCPVRGIFYFGNAAKRPFVAMDEMKNAKAGGRNPVLAPPLQRSCTSSRRLRKTGLPREGHFYFTAEEGR